MGAIEIIALIAAIIVILKVLLLIVAPKPLLGLGGSLTASYPVAAIIMLIIAAIVGYYLLMELTVVQIFATTLFMVPLVGLSFYAYPSATKAMLKEIEKGGLAKMWLPLILWLALAVWVLVVLFL